jgi:drug/metabolite transporter (DMT)-like permease
LKGFAAQALLLTLISATASGTMVFCLAKITRQVHDIFVAQFLFQLVGIPMLIVIAPIVPVGSIHGIPGMALLVGLGVLVTFAFTLYFHSLKVGNLAVIAPMQNAKVLITVTLAVAFLNETISPLRGFGIVAVVAGVVLLAVQFKSGIDRGKATLYRGVVPALIASAGLAFYQFFVAISDRLNSWYYTSLVIRIVIPITIALIFVMRGRAKELRTIFNAAPWRLITIAAFLDVVGFSTFNFALSRYDVSYVSVIASASPAVSVLLALIFLGEKLERYQKVGFALAIAGVAALNI